MPCAWERWNAAGAAVLEGVLQDLLDLSFLDGVRFLWRTGVR